jgi:hypothetical protein
MATQPNTIIGASAPVARTAAEQASSIYDGNYETAANGYFTESRNTQLTELGRSKDQVTAEEQEHIALLKEATRPSTRRCGKVGICSLTTK